MVVRRFPFKKTRTDRNPNNYVFKSNLVHHTLFETRHILADQFYQVFRRLHRCRDPFHLYVLPPTLLGLWTMVGQHLFFTNTFIFLFFSAISRTLSKTEEVKIDEIAFFDLLFKNDKVRSLFTPESFYVVDFNAEFDQGTDNPLFPEYRTKLAQFFNADCNTATGYFKLGDLESGATLTAHFKTMPISANMFWYKDPFHIYDLVLEINDNGVVDVDHMIKAEETLRAKEIFVPLF